MEEGKCQKYLNSNKPGLLYMIAIAFGFYLLSGIAFGYIASYALLRTVAYLSPWMPVWMWIADVGLFVHAVSLAATSAVGIISAIARKLFGVKMCLYILGCLLLVEIGVTVQLATRSDSLEHALHSDLEEAMVNSLKNYSRVDSDTQMWDEMQLENNCCGVFNYTDWFSTRFGDGENVPDSCCLMVQKGCGQSIIHQSDIDDIIITRGCLPTFFKAIEHDFYFFGNKIWVRTLVYQIVLIIVIVILVKKVQTLLKCYIDKSSLQDSKHQLLNDSLLS